MSEDWNGEDRIRPDTKDIGEPKYKHENEDKSAQDVCVVGVDVWM